MLKTLCLASLVATLLLGGCASRPLAEKAQTQADTAPPQATKKMAHNLPLAIRPQGATAAAQVSPSLPVDDASSVYFGFGLVEVDATGREKLRTLASKLSENPESTVTLTGYTDNLGSPSYSLAVAGERVDAVADILRSYGVAKNRIMKTVRGNETREANCTTKACQKKMRRVELKYLN